MIVAAIFSLACLAFIVIGLFVPNFNFSKLFYILGAELILPIRSLLGSSLNSSITTFSIVMSGIVFVLSITLTVFASKLFYRGQRKSGGAKVKIFIVLLSIALVYEAFTVVMYALKYSEFTAYFNSNSIPFNVEDVNSFNLIALKGIVLSGLLFIFTLLMFFVIPVPKVAGQKQVVFSDEMNFYSSEYDEVKTDTKDKKDSEKKEEKQQEKGIGESNEQSKQLIKNIMKLNEMKDKGEISNKEYTKLREKEIRRYQK